MDIKRVCVYCGSSRGSKQEYAEAARRCGQVLAERGISLVYGGGNVGLMGIVADTVMAAGGQVLGVIPHHLVKMEVAHNGLTSLVTVDSMHERKFEMASQADAFITLPGGIGTLEELFEVFTWLQLGLHCKPVGVLNVAGYYDSLLGFLKHMVEERFVRPEHLEMLLVDQSIEGLLEKFSSFVPKCPPKWIER